MIINLALCKLQYYCIREHFYVKNFIPNNFPNSIIVITSNIQQQKRAHLYELEVKRGKEIVNEHLYDDLFSSV